MKLNYHVNLTGICPELLCGMITVEGVYHEFGETMTITTAGKSYIKCDIPRDEVTACHMVHVIQKRLTEDFETSCDDDHIVILWHTRDIK
jgi:hypothetical protein